MDTPDTTTQVSTDPSADLEKYLKENPDFLIEFLKRNQTLIPTEDPVDFLQPALDNLTDTYPFTIPDTHFEFAGLSLTPYDIAGILVPAICIILLLLFMRNCYGYMGMYLWITVILGWYSLTTFLPKLELPFSKQIQLLSKYILILFSAVFLVYTVILLGLQLLSLPFKGLRALFGGNSSGPVSVAQTTALPTPQPSAPIPTTSRQVGGFRKHTNPPAAFLYVPPR